MANSQLSRREFLVAGAGAGLAIGAYVPFRPSRAVAATAPAPFTPNVWVRVGADDLVTVTVAEAEMGQGVMTSIPMLVAEELDVEWANVRVEFALADRARYGNQITAGSGSIRGGYVRLRKAGAAARALLREAAARQWGVDPAACRTEAGHVIHSDGRRLRYGVLTDAASALPVPEDPPLKDPATFRLVGTPVRRLDTPMKVDGSARFGIDVRLPGMLVASVAHPPAFGGSLRSFDSARALAVDGVRGVYEIPTGVAVVARDYWSAKKGRDALDVTWNAGPHGQLNSAAITAMMRDLTDEPGTVVRTEGNATAALRDGSRVIRADYEVPFLAHAPMEPMNCTANVTDGRCEIWAPTQGPTGAQGEAARITGLPPDRITVHTTFLGGGFGRRAQNDFVADAVHASLAAGAPVQVIWSREDDMRGGYYRPATYNRFEAALDADGWPVAWSHRIAGASIMATVTGRAGNRPDRTSIEGAANLPYAIPHLEVTYALAELPVPSWFWRSVGSSQNAFITEAFLDELATAGGKDPYELRRRLLADHPRHRRVLEIAAERAGWGTALPDGRARGIAVHESFGTFVAEVAEVSVESGRPRVHRVTAAVDCGPVVNPNTVEAQIESSIVYGLTAALYGEITIEGGGAKQSNFHDYQMLRIHEMPEVDVHLVPSTEAVGGIGEPGLPPIAPAVVNALATLTGRPVRKLPIDLG